jgi:phosphoribosylglycinamide formyltransferase-1
LIFSSGKNKIFCILLVNFGKKLTVFKPNLMNMKKLAIFASGSGTNAQRIIEYFSGHPDITVAMIFSNRPDAYVLVRARNFNIPSVVFNRHSFYETDEISILLAKNHIDFIVLAGFLWLIPEDLIRTYPGRIINIHPALLPKYGGKGMYGMRVHEAVLQSGDTESGISIHFVNEKYDEGDIIFQAKCEILPGDTPDTLAQRIHQLEYKHYPEVIEKLVRGLKD